MTDAATVQGFDRLLDAKEIAGRLGLSVRTVQRLTREGKIPHVRIGTHTPRYRWDAVVGWVLSIENPGETIRPRKHQPRLRSAG